MNSSVIVWDHKEDPPDEMKGILRWRGYANEESMVSVPRYLEANSKRLRSKYLAFIHDLGETLINGRRVTEHMDMGGGFSYWWMTQLAEKSPFKTPRIFDCLRLLALEELLVERAPNTLILDSGDRDLAEAVERLCINLEIKFVWKKSKKNKQKLLIRRIYQSLPYSLQGLISLRHLIVKWPFSRIQKPKWFSGDDAIFICSYFFNLDTKASKQGRFYSRQWETLPKFLQENGRKINWVHHFNQIASRDSVTNGLELINLFNRNAEKQGCHAILDEYLSLPLVFRALRSWVWISALNWKLRKIRKAFRPQNSAVWLWPLLKNDWNVSLTGTAAVTNCLWIELFDAMLASMPHQKMGLFLWENQGWESALIRAWRRHEHGKIIGIPHTTVVFWHLNNFDDARSIKSVRTCAKPLPDHLAINGPMAWKTFVEAGYPTERFIEVEAVRFEYLKTIDAVKSEKSDKYNETKRNLKGKEKRILILGDFSLQQTVKMLNCVQEALQMLHTKVSVTLKPHPICEVGRGDCPELLFDITDRPLAEILQNYDFAFSSNVTSASVEALIAGLPVAVFLDDENFNHSPLRGGDGVRFVATASELAEALTSKHHEERRWSVKDFFWLGGGLSKWEKALSIVEIENDSK